MSALKAIHLMSKMFLKKINSQIKLIFFLYKKTFDKNSFYSAGQFAFSYSRGNGECKYPVSKIKSCTEDTRMMLNFQACPDVEGSESTGELSIDKILINIPCPLAIGHTHISS